MNSVRWLRIIGAGVLSGILMSVILPNDLAANGWSLALVVALVPIFVVVYTGVTKRELLLLSLAWGTTHAWVGRYWLANFQEFGITILIALSCGLSLVSFLALIVLQYIVQNKRGNARVWRTTWFWVGFEYVRSHGFLADPWALVAYGFNQSRYLIQVIDIVGIFGLSFIVALTNAIISEVVISLRRNKAHQVWLPIVVLMLLVGAGSGYGAWAIKRYETTSAPAERVWHVALVQQNMDSWSRHWMELVQAHMQALESIVPFEVQPDLIVSSETTLLGDFESIFSQAEFRPQERPLADFIREHSAMHLFGALAFDDEYMYNGAFLIDAQAQGAQASYYKQQLVPFAEGLPARQWRWMGSLYRALLNSSHLMHSGSGQNALFKVSNSLGANLLFAVPICFEDAFPHITRQFVQKGVQVLINITNDSWSQRLVAQTQHMAIARYRAIESRRVMLRAANSGMTVHIDSNGDYVQVLEPFVRGALLTTVQLPEEQVMSLYVRFGDVIAYVALVMTLGYSALRYSQSPESSLFRSIKKAFSKLKRSA